MDNSADISDWEVLHSSDASDSGAEEAGAEDPPLESSCEAVFQSDYFCLDPHQKSPSSDDVSALSDNPSWIDPASDAPFPALPMRNCADSSSESGRDEKVEASEKKYWSEFGEAFNLDVKNESFLEELGAQGIIQRLPAEHDEKDSCGDEVVDDEAGGVLSGEPKPEGDKEGDGETASVVWWKLPLELLKCCVFRVSPVWSLSVAAAILGFVILGRRLYKMKRKSHGLKLKVIIDDKRVSQFMSGAARLNEAFSLVRRVPIVRPSLPAPGAAPWSAMSMR